MLTTVVSAARRSAASVAMRLVHSTPVAGAASKGSKAASPKAASSKSFKSTGPAPKILVTGCLGQIGSELVPLLRATHGAENVVASDVRKPPAELYNGGVWEYCDVANQDNVMELAVKHNVDWIVHMAGILSAAGERDPMLALRVNALGIHSVLEVARIQKLRVFAPSSIAAFGPTTPRDNTPNTTIQEPSTMYGVTKLHVEQMGRYYKSKYGLDFRSLRYPGIISAETPPGGGTTDYAVDIFYKALESNKFTCFLKPDSSLPMMMMEDCLAGTMQYLHADVARLNHAVYNIGAISFSPAELVAAMNAFRPGLEVKYEPDFRQKIADSWPKSLDDSAAAADWDWKPKYTLQPMVEHMFKSLSKRLKLKL